MSRRKLKIGLLSGGALSALALSWVLHAQGVSPEPAGYEALSAQEKQAILWDEHIVPTRYEGALPALGKVNALQFIFSALKLKLSQVSDFAPLDYEKPIHAHGVIAKVRFEAAPDSPYSGLFKGADFGLLRASLTADPSSMNVAPGVALKLLIDGTPSQNVSVLYKLSGQEQDHNFFANELSNRIPIEIDPKSIFSTTLFLRASKYPNKVSVKPFGRRDQGGQVESEANAPVQIYVVPQVKGFASVAHDFRSDFLSLAEGTVLYDIYASDEDGNDFLESDANRRAQAIKIGSLIQTSEFVTSAFGDSGIFFKHDSLDDD